MSDNEKTGDGVTAVHVVADPECALHQEWPTKPNSEARCPTCRPRSGPVVTACGCALEDTPCTMHRDGSDHRHCKTCGTAVFIDEVYEDGHVEYDDHHCPPGFLLSPEES